jgi:hypothetical protein
MKAFIAASHASIAARIAQYRGKKYVEQNHEFKCCYPSTRMWLMFIAAQHYSSGLIFTHFSSFINSWTFCTYFSHPSGLLATLHVFSANINETVTAQMQRFGDSMLLMQ